MAVNSSTDTEPMNGHLPAVRDFSMLFPFIYDTSSFSDRQVQVANADTTVASTSMEGQEPTPSRPNADATDHAEGKKGNKPVDK